MKRCFILTTLVLLMTCFNSHATDTNKLLSTLPKVWTAEQAVKFALAENPDSTIARQRIEQAQAAATMAEATDYPLVNVSSEYGQTNNPMYSFGNIINQGAFDYSIDFNNPGRTDNLQFKTQLNYRLYNGGRDLANKDAAKANIKVSENELSLVQQQLGFEVVKTYLAIIQAEQMVGVRTEALASITAALEVGKARYDVGSLLKQDLLNLELQQSRASENLIQSRHTLEITKRIFLNLLGLPEGNIAVDPDCVLDQIIPTTFDHRNHPELKRLEAMEKAALAELAKARGGKLPTLDAFASYQIDNGSVMNGTGDSWMAGVKMNYLLFDGNKRSSEISIAQLKLQEIKRTITKTELALNLEVQKALLDFEQAKKRLTVTEKMVGVATEAILLSRARFTEGVILVSDLIDFEMRLSDAQARHFAAKAAYQVAIANMRRAAGLDQFSMN
jgi:outer membrane protein